jgi:hypothetical protein
MPPRPAPEARARKSVGRALALACLSGGLLAGTIASVRAEDGLGGFLQRLFAPPPPAPVAAPPESVAPTYFGGGGRRVGRTTALRHRRARYAALTRPEPLPIQVGQRQTPLDLKDGVTAAFLKDETLRPGDIVILREGAHVFTGERGRQHRRSEFDPASRSARLDRKTRALLAAMVRPSGSMPVRVALRRPAQAAPEALPATRAEASLVRVVSPWRTAP